MKKKGLGLIIATALILSGCSISDYSQSIESATGIAEDAAKATKELAGDLADAAGIDKSEVKKVIKDTASEVKKEVKDVASDIKDEAVDASKEMLKDYAKKKLQEMEKEALEAPEADSESAVLQNTSDIGLTDTDGDGKNYTFTYNGQTFNAIYTTDNWKLKDSYRVENGADMLVICQTLIDEHPVHGKDRESFRTAEDMAYEWKIHNIAYSYLSEDDPLKAHACDVDFDPDDQGLTLEEFYKSRTGKDLDITELLQG